MARKLRKLKISEVSAVTAAANPYASVVLMKRDSKGKKKRRAAFTEAGELVETDKAVVFRTADDRLWDLPKGGALTEVLLANREALGLEVESDEDDIDDSVAKALCEIDDNRAFIKNARVMEGKMTDDIVAAMQKRISKIRKADPAISDERAMLKLAESRNPDDQVLWRAYKDGIVPAGAVAKEFDAEKAVRKMAKRVDQLMASDGTIRSRESAIAKVATSRDPDDQALWLRYREAGQATNVAALPHSPNAARVGKAGLPDPLQTLIETLMRAYGIGRPQAERWARQTLLHAPPEAMHTHRTRDAFG